jgi:hypothetical protein
MDYHIGVVAVAAELAVVADVATVPMLRRAFHARQ